ncbi:formate/nitrite transporter family protein [Agrobacterium rubi]|uniref:Putative formate/nitrite transporter n=1 Tax=Agrobacterium rubi TR3 = NBRC 13261 TaxID=1368415 RepID=A0A081CZ26_9HYPH|nr:formate/nitrite transporter family protein [Agrobacterium rubi]NTF09143.1 formate/nitrite transporter family protein [Agrobacterium rubi]NTF21413.1 formate/nitrite transporter family protein [Agrobacterium rubi]NTF28270.1 formate/nitrite transporter family protein [Agrobacterium rubi]GAK71922.1 putative formate/nitrite transporter [Agrobacterium rubi TR3 = NBRC 13261]
MSAFPKPAELTEDAFEALATKAGQPVKTIAVLGVLAGVYIGLGGVASTVALAGADAMPFGAAQILAGLVFSLGLAAVVIAGAELFTGNTLFLGPVMSGRVSTKTAIRALLVAYVANLLGSVALAVLVFAARFHEAGDDSVGAAAIDLATTKAGKSFVTVFASGVIANILVCLGVWFALAGNSVTEKLTGLLLPVTVFVAAGFEHSVANMYLLPYAYLIDQSQVGISTLTLSSIVSNISAATLGNIVGGGLIGVVYGYLFRRDISRS